MINLKEENQQLSKEFIVLFMLKKYNTYFTRRFAESYLVAAELPEMMEIESKITHHFLYLTTDGWILKKWIVLSY